MNKSIQETVGKDPLYKGNDLFLYFVFENEQGERIDISGDVFWLTLAKQKEQRLPDLQLRYEMPSDNKSANGEFMMVVPNSATQNLEGMYFFDLRRFVTIGPDTYKMTIEYGKIKVLDQINKV